MSNHSITTSSEFLNDFNWQLYRLVIMIETMEGVTKSARDLHQALSLLLNEANLKR